MNSLLQRTGWIGLTEITPSGDGDWETCSDLRKEIPEQTCCHSPTDSDTETPSGLSSAQADKRFK